jgi:transcription elongation GreA/GreB family factor
MLVPPKRDLHEKLCAVLRAELDGAMRAHKTAAEGATHEDARPENDKDTRALEQSYVARGQAARVRELEVALAETERMPLRVFREDQPIALGAVVVVTEDDAELAFMLAPHGGGCRLGDVQVVTPQSPMGRALLGKHAGDDCEVTIAGKRRMLTIERAE